MHWLVLTLALATGCGGDPTPAASPTGSAPDQVTGVVTEVRLEGGEVTAFVVETHEASHEILIDPEFEYGFDLRHLEVHQSSGDPVQVFLESRGGELYALSVLDA